MSYNRRLPALVVIARTRPLPEKATASGPPSTFTLRKMSPTFVLRICTASLSPLKAIHGREESAIANPRTRPTDTTCCDVRR